MQTLDLSKIKNNNNVEDNGGFEIMCRDGNFEESWVNPLLDNKLFALKDLAVSSGYDYFIKQDFEGEHTLYRKKRV